MADTPPTRREGPPLSEETIKELFAIQKQELALRLKEVERESAEIDYNRSVAQQSIEAQERDRKHAREEQTKRQRAHQNFVLLSVAGVLLLSAFALHRGYADLISDLVKVFLGFIGGMGYLALKRKKGDADPES